ncbi:hypothetical protein JTE90_028103 [Oedothorax gibbosus]|uniref:BED-type domain-containing protein n=1 Tax=Oedothorax gibbosus TaxID=931172 RepID=A0AAV6VA45_9ARAC|nr:hypothetical protein JTE90_028103 [Oedothorax gibbosus]
MAGRKKDSIWLHFTEESTTSGKGVKAKCKNCGKVIMGLVARLKKHVAICSPDDSEDFVLKQPVASCSTMNSNDEREAATARPTKRKAVEIERDINALKDTMSAYVVVVPYPPPV